MLKTPELRTFVVGHVGQSSGDFVDNFVLSTGPRRNSFWFLYLARVDKGICNRYIWYSKSDVIYVIKVLLTEGRG